jgi:hypothetical protein
MVRCVDVPEAPVEQTEHGLVCTGDGWFVVNAKEVHWYGTSQDEAYARFPPRTSTSYGGWLD